MFIPDDVPGGSVASNSHHRGHINNLYYFIGVDFYYPTKKYYREKGHIKRDLSKYCKVY